MTNTLFLYAAVIGGTMLAFQFVLMLLGWSDGDGGDLSGAEGADFSAGADGALGGDLHGDVGGAMDAGDGHHPTWTEAADADLGHPGAHWFYEMLSLRTISAAVTFFGLAGGAAQSRGMSQSTSLIVALAAGFAAMYGVYWLFKQVYKVQHAGNENVRLAVGLPATVYVPVPAARGGVGKVMFRLQDRTVEYQAVTEEGEKLRTGEKVVITGIVNSDTVAVARVPQPAKA